MTEFYDEREEISAILFGAKAYCSFAINLSLLPKVLNTVMANELWVDRKFVTRLLTEIEDITQAKHSEAQRLDKGIATLTPRETEIACLVATGASNRRIAELLSISERTVKAHLGVIFRKIGISDRLQLALYMNRHRQLSSIWHGKIPSRLGSQESDRDQKH
jgi:DNA-binding NarL/FixJ family response regulator